MKKIIVIGLGTFGGTTALTLEENDCEVLGIDKNKEIIAHFKNELSHTIIADAKDKEMLESLNLKDFDAAIIGLGEDMAASILITMYLKEIGLKKIICRANTTDHSKILKKVGATETVCPEIDTAYRLGNKISFKNALDFLPLYQDYAILEVTPPKEFLNQTLRNLQITKRFHCQIIGLKTKTKLHKTKLIIPPTADDIITEDCAMIVIGKIENIKKMKD